MQQAVSNLPCLKGFEHINRYWDRRHEQIAAKILPGEYYVTCEDELITTVLGSCISVCAYDPAIGVGGMNHFMLPSGNGVELDIVGRSFRYGDVAMERMLNTLYSQGAHKKRLIFKAFGGGHVMAKMTDIGELNIAFLRKFMSLEGFRLDAEDLSGPYPRKVIFYPCSGKVMVKRLQAVHNNTIYERETSYEKLLSEPEQVEGDIDLFD